MRVKAKLKEMTDAKALFVSLVDRGANRIPFRITKSHKEHEMLDLSKLGKSIKAAVVKAGDEVTKQTLEIAALVCNKGTDANFAAVTKALKDAGFKIDTVKDLEGGAVMFVQDEKGLDGAQNLKVNDQLVAVVKGFDPYATPSGDFEESLKVDGLYGSIWNACSALQKSMTGALSKAATPEDAAKDVSATLDKFKDYVSKLVADLPPSAFKAAMLMDAAQAEVALAETAAKEAKDKADADAAAKKAEDEKTAEADKAKDAMKAEVKGDLDAALGPVAKAIEGLTETVKTMGERIEAQGKQITEVAAKAEATDKAVKSTVVAPSGSGDTTKGQPVKKHAQDGFIIDTAYDGKTQKYDKLGA